MVDLSKGLLIENENLLIPWGITNEEAWHFGKPIPFNLPDDKTRMQWTGAVILNGLECIVQTYFPKVSSKLSQFNILDFNDEKHSPETWAETLRSKCKEIFQPVAGNNSWRQGNVTFEIRHDNRFVEAYWLEIART